MTTDPGERSATARLAPRRGHRYFTTATRAGVLVGVSAAVYAVSLATVAGIEAQTQSQSATAVKPALDALAGTRAANDEIATAVGEAAARLQALARDYASAGADMAAYQARFEQLSALVAQVQGSAAAINANFTLPTVSMRGAIGGGSPTVVTTTSASGRP